MMRCLQCGEPLDADDTYGLCEYCTYTEEPPEREAALREGIERDLRFTQELQRQGRAA